MLILLPLVVNFMEWAWGISDVSNWSWYEKAEVLTFSFGQVVMIAILYQIRIISVRRPFPERIGKKYDLGIKDNMFRHEASDCCDEVEYCCQALTCCCLWARIGDTYHTVGIANFWVVQISCLFVQNVGLILLAFDWHRITQNVAWGWSVMCLSLYFAVKRRRLRLILRGDVSTLMLLRDCCCYLTCTTCIAIQDARQVDEIQNTRVQCPCRLVHTMKPGGMPVGMPVQVKGGSSSFNSYTKDGAASPLVDMVEADVEEAAPPAGKPKEEEGHEEPAPTAKDESAAEAGDKLLEVQPASAAP